MSNQINSAHHKHKAHLLKPNTCQLPFRFFIQVFFTLFHGFVFFFVLFNFSILLISDFFLGIIYLRLLITIKDYSLFVMLCCVALRWMSMCLCLGAKCIHKRTQHTLITFTGKQWKMGNITTPTKQPNNQPTNSPNKQLK